MHVSMRKQVDAALEQAVGLLLVGVAQLGEADVAEARQLRAGPDRAGDVAGPAVGGVVVGDLAGDAGRGDVELVGLVGDAVLGEHGREAPKVAVSTASTPTAKNASCMPAMTSGRVRQSISLQPSRSAPPKSSAVRSRPWTYVPNAPSKTTTRSGHGVEVGLAAPWDPRLRPATGVGACTGVDSNGCASAVGWREPIGSRAAIAARSERRSTRRRATTARPGLFYGGRVRQGLRAADGVRERRRGAGRASGWPGRTPAGELDDMLVPILRDLWVLMAELATLPENRSQARARRDGRDAGDGRPSSSARSTSSTSASSRRRSSSCPAATSASAWLDLARTVVRRAERHSLAARRAAVARRAVPEPAVGPAVDDGALAATPRTARRCGSRDVGDEGQTARP